jgi:phosphoribosyl isomerase A
VHSASRLPASGRADRLVLLPAVDLAGGQAVQLVQGRAGSEKQFGDPRAAAKRWQDAGAEWIHLVDLDAAFERGNNAEIIAELTSHLRLSVELSGGIRDDESLERALATGCARVNIGTAALERPEWCEEIIDGFGERIAVGLDVRGNRLAARGWTREGGDLLETLHRLDSAGCARFVVTDVSADGMLGGPNLDLLRRVCDETDKPVIASGGVSTIEDILALRDMVRIGIEGAIIGTALYVGRFTIEEALVAAQLDSTTGSNDT